MHAVMKYRGEYRLAIGLNYRLFMLLTHLTASEEVERYQHVSNGDRSAPYMQPYAL
jgi:hypothetical protein